MNIYSVPMLITGVLCTVLAVVTWMFRRRESINRIFSFFTLALAVDSFNFFMWYEFGTVEHIRTWIRIINTTGFLIPIGLVLFFFAFTGYDKKLHEKVLRIRAGHFRIFAVAVFIGCMLLCPFTDLMVRIPDVPENIWDVEEGPVSKLMFPLFAGLFSYMLVMVFKSYRTTDSKPQKRFILLLALGTMVWVVTGYITMLFISTTSAVYQFTSYIGVAVMSSIYFIAIVNYQSDQVHELNVHLERKVEERTRQLKEMQQRVIIQEKMASLGQLVAGLTHELNTPVGTIISLSDTKNKAALKLQDALEKAVADDNAHKADIRKLMHMILNTDRLIDQGSRRLNDIIMNLKNFTRLDEADIKVTDIHEGIDSTLALLKSEFLSRIEIQRDYGDIPPFKCNPRKLNQVFLNLLKNASQAIEDQGRITISTGLRDNHAHIVISDTGRGIRKEDLEAIFDPGFSSKSSTVRARLGLSICRQIVQEHEGEIRVASEPGKGSSFTVILPLTVTGVS